MLCKKCGKMTSTVICQNCGENVVWYNKFGKTDNTSNIVSVNEINDIDSNECTEIEDILQEMFKEDTYVEDGSGD